MRKRRKKKRNSPERRRRRLTVFLVILLLAGLGFVTAWKGFVVKKVYVEGSTVYPDEKIEEWVLNDEYCWNSLYVYVKNKIKKPDELPFVDRFEVSLKSPRQVVIKVKEKNVLGYMYIPALGQNAYIDKDGYVIEISPETIGRVMKISGVSVGDVKLHEKLKIENAGMLQSLLAVTQMLRTQEQLPDLLMLQERGVLLCYGDIQVNLGDAGYLEEKILRMQQLLPKLSGMKGTLHLETWTKNSTDAFFRKDELAEIPQDAPVTEETEQPNE